MPPVVAAAIRGEISLSAISSCRYENDGNGNGAHEALAASNSESWGDIARGAGLSCRQFPCFADFRGVTRDLWTCLGFVFAHAEDFFVWMGWGHYSGDIAVDAFFLISGFLVTGSLVRRHDLYHFLKARFLRVVPAFALNVIVLSLIYGAALTTLSLSAYYTSPHTWSYITQNLKYTSHMVWDLPGVFEHTVKRATINGSQWTLPAEVRMYMFLGIFGAVGLLRKKWIAAIALLGLYVVGLVVPDWLPLHPSSWLRLAGFFLIGVAAYVYRGQIKVSWQLVIALAWLALLTRDTQVYALTFSLALAGFVFACAYLTPPLRKLERFGDPSYGIYLWGWPIGQLVAYFFPGLGLAPFVALSVVAAILAGYTSWWVLEKQVLRLK